MDDSLTRQYSASLKLPLILDGETFFLVLVGGEFVVFMSFRLAEERQAAAEQRLQQPAAEDRRQKMLDSLSKAGVDNFTMKSAVPGTEVPGHKVQ